MKLAISNYAGTTVEIFKTDGRYAVTVTGDTVRKTFESPVMRVAVLEAINAAKKIYSGCADNIKQPILQAWLNASEKEDFMNRVALSMRCMSLR